MQDRIILHTGLLNLFSNSMHTSKKRSISLPHVRNVRDSRRFLMIGCGVILLILIAYPVSLLVAKSFPLSNYISQFNSPQMITAIKNTFYVAAGVTMIAAFLGVILAFLIVRTDIPFKKTIHTCIHLIFLTPGYIGSVAWIQLLGRSGYVTRWAKSHFGLSQPLVDIYTLEGVIIVMGLYLMPLVYMAAVNALRNSDPSLEDAAFASGASPTRAIFDVTLPLALPGIFSNMLLVFIHGISGFGIPAALGMPAGNMVLTTLIYSALGHYDVRMACAVSVMLILLMALALLAHNKILPKGSYAGSASSKAVPYSLHLGHWKYLISGVIVILLICVSVIPLITIFLTSLLKAWGLPILWGNLTLGNYISIFSVGIGVRALFNSFLFSLVGATCATVLGFFIAYFSQRTRGFGQKFLDFLATAPSAIPGPVLAAAMIFAWMLPPFELYNTPWIIIISYIVAFLPYTLRNIAGGMKALNAQLEEMGWMCGGSWMRVLRDIVIPNLRGCIWTGWMLAFLMAFREIPLSSMLYANGTETVGVLLFLLKSESGGLEVTSAVSIVVIVLTIIGHKLVKRTISYEEIIYNQGD